jgi:hypothetical protein
LAKANTSRQHIKPIKKLKDFSYYSLANIDFAYTTYANLFSCRGLVNERNLPTPQGLMMKYKLKPNKHQMGIIKEAWKQLQSDEHTFHRLVSTTEEWMQKETGIKDIEFFFNDGYYCGVGNVSRTMKLIHDSKLEK